MPESPIEFCEFGNPEFRGFGIPTAQHRRQLSLPKVLLSCSTQTDSSQASADRLIPRPKGADF